MLLHLRAESKAVHPTEKTACNKTSRFHNLCLILPRADRRPQCSLLLPGFAGPALALAWCGEEAVATLTEDVLRMVDVEAASAGGGDGACLDFLIVEVLPSLVMVVGTHWGWW